MQLSVKGFALAFGIALALWVLLNGLMALVYPDWGARFMMFMGSVYPGVEGVTFGQVVVATVYALVDGAIGGAVIAWLYNRFSTPKAPSVGAL